jgi:hypothetical protein
VSSSRGSAEVSEGVRRYRGAALASSRWVVSEASLAKDVERGS